MTRRTDLDRLAREMRGTAPWRASLLLAAIIALLVSAGLWAAWTEIDDVTRADGRIVPSGDVQVIQASEQGVVQAIHVREGEVVAAGALLMELDSTQQGAQLGQEEQRAFGLMARIARLQAEIDGRALDFAADLVARAPGVTASEAALFAGRAQALQNEITILERQRAQRREERAEAAVDALTATETLQVLAEERALMEPLVKRGIEPATTLLTLRRAEADWQGRKVRAESAQARLETALFEIDDRIAAARSRQRADTLTDLSIATAELAALRPLLPALAARAEGGQIRAPVRGIVNRLHRSTLGGLARPGEDLIELVPLDDTLLVEAYLRPADIAFLFPGQPAKIKVTAYDFARYGALDGEILRIGADTVRRSERDEAEVFVVEIRTSGTILDADGVAVEIIPGMVTEVDILTGRKTVLDYLLRPVIRVRDRAFRE